MNHHRTGIQLYFQEQDCSFLDFARLRRLIFSTKRYFDFDFIIIGSSLGFNNNLELFKNIIEMCSVLDVKTYLWFPVLSDVLDYSTKSKDLNINFDGSTGAGNSIIWKNNDFSEEEFRFMCPNSGSTEAVFGIYKKYMENFDFKGIFLDKIRYPSPSNGIEAVFSCFCKRCSEKFNSAYGYDIQKIKSKIKDFFNNIHKIEMGKFKSFAEMLYYLELVDFIKFRENNILELIKRFSRHAQSKNLELGLDLFTFTLSDFVAQNYQKLERFCDWIKPMVYCRTFAPAGIPLELYTFAHSLISKGADEQGVLKMLFNMIETDRFEKMDDIRQNGINESFIKIEMRRIHNELSDRIDIIPGFEGVYIPGVCEIKENNIKRYLGYLIKSDHGFILSWNLLNIPESNLKIAGELLKRYEK